MRENFKKEIENASGELSKLKDEVKTLDAKAADINAKVSYSFLCYYNFHSFSD